MWTARAIRDAVNGKVRSAQDVVEEALRRIQEKDGEIGGFLEVFQEDSRAAAQEVDARIASGEVLPLAGVPVAIKDNMLVAGHIASAGSTMLKDYRASYTATVVAKLHAAGAIIIGRTNMDEFAMGSSTETSSFQKTKNPHDTTKTPGGSSGGSAAVVAAGMVPVSLGSDTGGSIRQPAALCGVVGMKPTYGRVSRYGIVALASSLDQVGPFATTVEDAALVLSVIEGQDPHDATSMAVAPVALSSDSGVKDLRIGVPKEFFPESMDAEVTASVRGVIESLRARGAEIVDISLPLISAALPAYYIIQPAEASSNLARFDGMRYGTRAPGNLSESYRAARGEGFGDEVKRRILIGTYVLSSGYYDAYYKRALSVRAALKMQFDAAFAKVDVIIGPTSPVVAWGIGEHMDDPVAMYLADIFTVAANIIGIPGISVPCAPVRGLPVGVQVLGPMWGDSRILEVAQIVERLER